MTCWTAAFLRSWYALHILYTLQWSHITHGSTQPTARHMGAKNLSPDPPKSSSKRPKILRLLNTVHAHAYRLSKKFNPDHLSLKLVCMEPCITPLLHAAIYSTPLAIHLHSCVNKPQVAILLVWYTYCFVVFLKGSSVILGNAVVLVCKCNLPWAIYPDCYCDRLCQINARWKILTAIKFMCISTKGNKSRYFVVLSIV